MRYQIAEYEQRDAMPREVAIELLTTEKLTARVRKTCRQALERAVPSKHPVCLAFQNEDGFLPAPRSFVALDFEKGEPISRHDAKNLMVRVFDTEIEPKRFKTKVAERMRRVPFARLVRMLRRIDRRSRSVHQAMMRAANLRTEGLRDELLARLQTQLDKFAQVRQIVVDEILIGRERKHE